MTMGRANPSALGRTAVAWLVAGLVAFGATVGAGPAIAAPPTEAEKKVADDLHKKATRAYQKGNRRRAIELWREALRLHLFWKYAYNMAHTLYEEGAYLQSWTWVTRSEALGFPADQANLLDLLAELRVKVSTALLKGHAWIELKVIPGDAVVRRDGVIWEAPRAAWTARDTSVIRVEAPGFTPQEFTWTHPITRRYPRTVTLESVKDGRIHVIGTPAGAEVLIDGKPIGVLPMEPRSLTPGTHVVRVVHEGYQTDTFEVTLRPGKLERVTVDLVETIEEPKLPEKTYRDYTIAGWTSLGAGIALAATGAGLVAWSDSINSDLLALDGDPAQRAQRFGADYQAYRDYHDSEAKTRDDSSIAGWTLTAIGGAATIAGIVLLVMNDPPPDGGSQQPVISVLPLERGAAVMGKVTF